jgi:hypothetical protein
MNISSGNVDLDVRGTSGLIYHASLVRVNKYISYISQPDNYKIAYIKAEAVIVLKRTLFAFVTPYLLIQYDCASRVANMDHFKFYVSIILGEANLEAVREGRYEDGASDMCTELGLLPEYYYRRSLTFRRIPILVLTDYSRPSLN